MKLSEQKKIKIVLIKFHNVIKLETFKFIVLAVILTLVLSLPLFISGCKDEKTAPENLSSQSIVSESGKESQLSPSASSSTVSEQSSNSEFSQTQKTSADSESAPESSEEIPHEITDLIEKGNSYYKYGEYGLAKNTYRKAEIAIDNSYLQGDTKKSLMDTFYLKYKKSKEIVETAKIHYANSMQLIYEQNYKEAKRELEAAIAIYPKYKEALEAYENLKTIENLNED